MTDSPYTYGPLTWVRCEDQSKCEVWEPQVPAGLPTTHFVLKNYGGTPGPGFKGWKLVSGSPFDRAGAYNTFEEAVAGTTSFLLARWREDVNEHRERADRVESAVNALMGKLGGHMPNGAVVADNWLDVTDDAPATSALVIAQFADGRVLPAFRRDTRYYTGKAKPFEQLWGGRFCVADAPILFQPLPEPRNV